MFIVPNPQKIEIKEEKLSVKSIKIVSDCSEIEKFILPISDDNAEIKAEFKKDNSLKEEHYKISVDKEGIHISYGEPEGAFRALATLKQIIAQIEDGKISFIEIDDYPSIKNRGYMLDISRGKIPSLEFLKSLVDIMADIKMNQLQLYMEAFVYEYKNFPEYWKDTEPLTRAEIKELNEYCKERFIALVPNQNGFGHMGAWTSKKELSHLAITNNNGNPSSTLNPFLEGSIELLDKIYDGYFDSFSSDIVNIGMDEPFDLGLNETKEQCDKLGVGKVYTDYLKKVCKLISEKYNKTPMFWDDIVFKHEEEIENIPKNTIVMEWGYETEQHFDRNCRKLQEKGLRFYVCPGTSMWGTVTGRTNNAIVNMAMAAECGNYYGAEGFLLTEWGDGGHPQFPSTAMFPLVFGAAVSWNSMDHNHEIAYEQRRNLIYNCKCYVDKYIYNCTSKKSLCDIIYRMGNYYLIEDSLIFNNAELLVYMRKKVRSELELPDYKKEAFSRVKKYMLDLRKELDEVEANEIAIREIRCNCDMVILFAGVLSGEEDYYEKEIERVAAEFEALWKLKNHTAGINIFSDFIKNSLN